MKALRLMRPHGQPTTSTADERFIREIGKLDDGPMADAIHAITVGRLNDDAELVCRGVRKLASVGFHMQEMARGWERAR